MPFYWTFQAFQSLLTTLSHFDILIYMCWYQSLWRVNHRWISAAQHWKLNVSELRKTALNSAVSERIGVDQLWDTAGQRWSLLCSLNQRWKSQNSETALLSADYLWDFNPGYLLLINYKFVCFVVTQPVGPSLLYQFFLFLLFTFCSMLWKSSSPWFSWPK